MPEHENLIDHPIANLVADLTNAIVRPLVTVMLATSAVVFTWSGIVSGDFFMGVAGSVIAYWFGQRTAEKHVEAIQEQTKAIKEQINETPSDRR
jgi:hypothetical protein